MLIKIVDKRKNDCPYIFTTQGIKRDKIDTKEKVKEVQKDGSSIIKDVPVKGTTEILAVGGIGYTLRITDAEHTTLASKYTGGDTVIATINIDANGEATIA